MLALQQSKNVASMVQQIMIFVETFEMNIINFENKYTADRNTTFY